MNLILGDINFYPIILSITLTVTIIFPIIRCSSSDVHIHIDMDKREYIRKNQSRHYQLTYGSASKLKMMEKKHFSRMNVSGMWTYALTSDLFCVSCWEAENYIGSNPFVGFPAWLPSASIQEHCICGKSQESESKNRIIGGRETSIKEFPWMVRIIGGCAKCRFNSILWVQHLLCPIYKEEFICSMYLLYHFDHILCRNHHI